MTKHTLLLISYLIIRFPLDGYLANILPYGSYLFEIIIIILGFLLYRQNFNFEFDYNRSHIKLFLLWYSLGFITNKLGMFFGLAAPFSTNNVDLIFLIFLGPLIEELLFRFTLFNSLLQILKNQFKSNIAISLIFSFSHLFPYFFISDLRIKHFILYQTVYTFLISFYWTNVYIKSNRLDLPIWLHVLFNGGFALAMVF